MAEHYQDPETDRPIPIRRRTGSFPIRSNTIDSQRYHLPTSSHRGRRRAPRARPDEPEDYPPFSVPGLYAQGSHASQGQARPPQQNPGYQYGGYGYPVDQPPPGPPIVSYVRSRDERTTHGHRRGHHHEPQDPGPPPILTAYAPLQSRHYRAPSPSPPRSRSPTSPQFEATSRTADFSEFQASDASSGERSPTIRYAGTDAFNPDEVTTAKVYEFRPSRLTRSPSQDPSLVPSGSDGEGPSLEPARTLPIQGEGASASKTTRTLKIYRSEYTGDAVAEGSQSARLTVIHDPKRTRQPIFRWLHIKQSSLNFDDLSHKVSHISGLSDGDKKGLAKLLTEVKKNFVKSTPAPNGSNMKHMEPKFFQVLLSPDERSKGQSGPPRTATWLCIPYFSLERYAGPLSTVDTSTFPTRTLLQEQYSGVPTDRDMKQQVVRQLGHAPSDMCFHISQFWCIILDNELLITCGTDSAEAALKSDVIDIVRQPRKDSSAGGVTIYVYYTEAVLWALPVDEHTTWFTFISNFVDFWPQVLCFYHRDHPITADDWPRILNLARHSSSKTMLHLKIGNAPEPPPRGILKPLPKDLPGEKPAEEPARGLKPPRKGKGNADPNPDPADEEDEADDKFHVFCWLEPISTKPGDRNSKLQNETVRAQLQEIEDYLMNSTGFSDKRVYQDCPSATRLSCCAYLSEWNDAPEKFKKRPRMRKNFEDRIDILNAAELVYRFFLPQDFDGPTVKKFWGAINVLIQMPVGNKSRSADVRRSRRALDPAEFVVPAVRTYLRNLTQAIQSFKNILSHAEPLERAGIKVPDELIRAWMHLLMALIYSTQGAQAWRDHLEIVLSLIKTGMEGVIDGMTSDSLLDKVVVLPLEIVSLLSLKLLEDSTGTYPNIRATYSEYLDSLANEIATKPSDRSFQHRIRLLKQEIGVIMKTVAAQTLIYSSLIRSPFKSQGLAVNDGPAARLYKQDPEYHAKYDVGRTAHGMMRMSVPDKTPPGLVAAFGRNNYNMKISADPYFRNDYGGGGGGHGYDGGDVEDWMFSHGEFYKLSPTEPAGLRDLLIAECLALLENRTREFDGFELHANDLQEENMNKFEDSKDRQELAIYAFTIVTVIFLPLSFVAGVFGMNTSDIREMELGQWAYWASAVPVTVLVILIGLWWMGEIGNAFAWLGFRNRGGGGGYIRYGRSSGGGLAYKPSRKAALRTAYQESYPGESTVDETSYDDRSSEPVRVGRRHRRVW